MNALQVVWFVLIGILLAGYMILDGSDLGIGFWHIFKADNRKALRGLIAPFWDANEVWILTAGGALFAAFPGVYATIFSGFYLPLMLVVFALIFRAVSFEFSSHEISNPWRSFWEYGFSIGSILPAVLFGLAMGNVLNGIPMDSTMNFTGTFLSLLNPYSLLVGITGFTLFAAHSALYIQQSQNENLKRDGMTWAIIAWPVYFLLFLITIITTIITQPHLLRNFQMIPALWILPILSILAIIAGTILNALRQSYYAYITSCISIVTIIATLGTALFPSFIIGPGGSGESLTIVNSSSSPLTLEIMLIVAITGMALVIGYTIWVRIIFRGKETSYY